MTIISVIFIIINWRFVKNTPFNGFLKAPTITWLPIHPQATYSLTHLLTFFRSLSSSHLKQNNTLWSIVLKDFFFLFFLLFFLRRFCVWLCGTGWLNIPCMNLTSNTTHAGEYEIKVFGIIKAFNLMSVPKWLKIGRVLWQ